MTDKPPQQVPQSSVRDERGILFFLLHPGFGLCGRTNGNCVIKEIKVTEEMEEIKEEMEEI